MGFLRNPSLYCRQLSESVRHFPPSNSALQLITLLLHKVAWVEHWAGLLSLGDRAGTSTSHLEYSFTPLYPPCCPPVCSQPGINRGSRPGWVDMVSRKSFTPVPSPHSTFAPKDSEAFPHLMLQPYGERPVRSYRCDDKVWLSRRD